MFAGNTHDRGILQTIVATMEARYGVMGGVWITDRGMASAENLAWLRQTGRRLHHRRAEVGDEEVRL